MKIIGFAGKKYVGKTTAARHLITQYEDSVVLSFATPLKKCVMELFDFQHQQMTDFYLKEQVDDRYGVYTRFVLQRFGTDFVRKTVPDLWLILMRNKLKEMEFAEVKNVFIDDVRFDDEAAMIKELGGTVINIVRELKNTEDGHASEQGVSWQDCTIYNSMSLDAFKLSVSNVFASI